MEYEKMQLIVNEEAFQDYRLYARTPSGRPCGGFGAHLTDESDSIARALHMRK